MSIYPIGECLPRKDGRAKVTGKSKFGADWNVTGQLYAAVLHSPHGHAKILSVDVSEAKKLPGVRAVLCGACCEVLYGHMLVDQPIFAVNKVRYYGEPVAAVAADDLRTAKEAVRLIKVEYEPLPLVDSIDDALSKKAMVHDDLMAYQALGGVSPVAGTNIVDTYTLKHGDIDEGFKQADVVVENEFYCAMGQHTPLETHVAIADADEHGCHVYTPAQSPFMIRGVLAKAFGYRVDRVRVTCTEIGGGFGCKVEARLEPIAIALSRAARKPVKIENDRGEEFESALCRGPVRFRMKTGATKDGKLVAQHMLIHWDTGAYTTFGPRINFNAGFGANGPYHIPNAFVDSYVVMTNKTLATAYRGFGITEVACAHETQMEALAEKLGMDSLEFRLKNVLRDGMESVTGEIVTSMGGAECLEKAAEGIGWKDKPRRWVTEDGKLRGKGLACYMKLTGTPSTTSAMLRVNDDGTVTLLEGSRELGQGVETALPQIAASVLGMNPERILMSPVDTAFTPYDKTTTASRSTFHGGNAVMLAAKEIIEKLKPLVAKKWKVDLASIVFKDGVFTSKNNNTLTLHMDDIGKSGIMKEEPPVLATGTYGTKALWDAPDKYHQSKRPAAFWMIGAQAAEVEIDPKTGTTKIIRMGAAHDVGKAINPDSCRQQIEGSLVMGVGNAIMEEMIYQDGVLVNGNLVDYKIPTSMDADFEMNIALVEKPDPEGPHGVKGIGEPGLAPTAPSIINAISAACEHRFTTMPVKPEDVLFRGE
ncbi:MAG: xanthine dehydrogenase family protein molybdopterin-binding subunit [Oscillospiraceae bacterium]|nr:xanthine dehydrogenase family protein molybdopterin-binding subunit [Oscillospiraceae bacterium]